MIRLPIQFYGIHFVFFIVLVPTHIIGGLIVASLINAVRNRFFHSVFRISLYFPMVVTTASVALVWGYLYDSDFGVFNWLLSQFGIDKVRWLGDERWSIFSIAIFSALEIYRKCIPLLLYWLAQYSGILYRGSGD